MRLNEDAIKRLITAIGYAPQNGKNGIYCKSYSTQNGYSIFIDFNNEKIIYDSDENPKGIAIKVWGRTTSNFSQAENFVVLECVDRLLTKGYASTCIELEKTYPSGHGHSGRLDILVKTADDVPFLMIECKTWGSEYEKEKGRMTQNGGQLFSYYSNARATRYLCLYTSRIEEIVEYHNSIVDIEDAWAGLSEVKDIYSHWNKNFKDNGIFDSYAVPYDVKHKALTYGKLEILKEEHSGKIYNQIMEILRHNAISDKPNAFNKLLNLFVCKIIDEADKNPEDELEFQWLEKDSDESLQLRLNDLYKRGMWRFLEIEVIDYEQKEVSEKLTNIEDASTRQWIMKMYTDTRLKKSPNFAFVEVQDDRTFELNAKVVREIVELLQAYKFRYEQKHEFLGNFFELLLNTSMKQEVGQFFTPVPITHFIISSLPLAKIVQQRVDDRADELLPTVIDYACGSGHFLTEYMSQMQSIIDEKIDLSHTSKRIKDLFRLWQGYTKFIWAKDTVYGIDLDNRLVKTTKVSAFFNGDGEANIIWANGLDSFTKSKAFRGKLVNATGKDNGKFDILISNPPYSVEAFKSTIEHGEESFELYSGLTDNSSEIECLFVERMKQLLKAGGWAAVILPSSILTNSGIHAKARAILLKYFKVKAIVEAGANTFMKTNTSTVILFLERINNEDHLNIKRAIDRFFTAYDDVAVSGIENAFSAFVFHVYEGLTLKDYVSLFNGTPSAAVKSHELYADYVEAFGEDFRAKAIEVEKEKLLYFLLTYNQTIVLINTGKAAEEKKFLGYKFSERRGHEGLHWLSGGTKLYDEADSLNPQKASSYIYRAFLEEQCDVDESLRQNVFYGQLYQFIEYGTNKFDITVNLGKNTQPVSKYSFPTVRLAEVANIEFGDRIVKSSVTGDMFPVYGGGGETFRTAKWNREDRYIISRFGMSSDCVRFVKGKFFLNDSGMTVSSKDETVLNSKYLNLFLLFQQPSIYAMGRGPSQKNIDMESFKRFKLPLPPIDIQQKIVDKMDQVEKTVTRIEQELIVQRNEIAECISTVVALCEKPLGQITICNPSKSIISDLPDDTTVSFIEMSAVSNDGHIVRAVDRLLGTLRKGSYTYFQENDIIVAKITPCMENGKCALATGLTNGIGMGSSEFHVFRCGDSILPEYLFAFLNRDVIRTAAESVMTGASGHKRVPITFYQQLRIPLPPLREQQKIVEQIQAHETRIAQLNIQLNELNAQRKTQFLKNIFKE